MISRLSVIIPAYNEEKTILQILEKVCQVKLGALQLEIIIIDDCSKDKTVALVEEFIREHRDLTIQLIRQDKNMGKGAALHRGIAEATGEFLVIQDADLEYDPNEYTDLLEPVFKDNADAVYGSRFMGSNPHRILFFWHTIGNRFLTFLSNMFTNLNLSDMETCYKLMRTEMVQNLNLKEKRFGFEPEVTAKVSRVPGVKIYEVGISYFGRTYEDGKKINWKDGVKAIYCIFKYNLFQRR